MKRAHASYYNLLAAPRLGPEAAQRKAVPDPLNWRKTVPPPAFPSDAGHLLLGWTVTGHTQVTTSKGTHLPLTRHHYRATGTSGVAGWCVPLPHPRLGRCG